MAADAGSAERKDGQPAWYAAVPGRGRLAKCQRGTLVPMIPGPAGAGAFCG